MHTHNNLRTLFEKVIVTTELVEQDSSRCLSSNAKMVTFFSERLSAIHRWHVLYAKTKSWNNTQLYIHKVSQRDMDWFDAI